MPNERVLNKVRPEIRLSAGLSLLAVHAVSAMPDSPFHPHAATTC